MFCNIKSSRILARDISVSNDTWATGLNNNDLVVGPPGSGKTRGYVIPNILHAQDSLIVADTKGNLYRLYGRLLEEAGYTVMHLDFKDADATPWGYNPLAYIRECRDVQANRDGDFYREQDVKKIAQAICPETNSKEPFWDQAARMYLEAILLFVLNQLPEKQHDLYQAYTILTKLGTDEAEEVIDAECLLHPDSAFARKMEMISQNAKAERMDALVNLFYTQALQYLMDAADRQPDSRLPIPVRLLLDDFSTNTVIPDFDKIASVIRFREIYVTLVIQSLSQLEGLYGHAKAQTIINSCDHCLYLGGTDIRTARYFAEKLNCQVSTVLSLPLDSMYLFARGSEPRRVRKYDLGRDEVYRRLMEPFGRASSGSGGKR